MFLAPSAAPVAVQARPNNSCRRWFTWFLDFIRKSMNCITTPTLLQLDSMVSHLPLAAVCRSKVGKHIVTEPRAVATRPFITSVRRQQKAGRYRSRFCNDGSLLLATLDRHTGSRSSLFMSWILSVVLCAPLCPSVVNVFLGAEFAKTTTTSYNSRHSLISAPKSCCAPVA